MGRAGKWEGIDPVETLMQPRLLDPRPYFRNLPDPRRVIRNKRHALQDILMIVLNVLRHNGPSRDRIRRRKLRAALNDEYRLNLLLGIPIPATT